MKLTAEQAQLCIEALRDRGGYLKRCVWGDGREETMRRGEAMRALADEFEADAAEPAQDDADTLAALRAMETKHG